MCEVAEQEGRTILYVSHNMNTIRQLCDRCIVLQKGHLVYDGDVEEAISIYMNQSDELKTSYDYSNIPRSENETRSIQLLGLDINDRTENRVSQGENLKFTLHCKANAEAENVGFRFEIYYKDGTVVGTVFTNKELSASKGQKVDLDIELATKNFAPGRYHAVALAYEYDKFGNQVGVDRVEPALVFEVTNKDKGSLRWLHQYWGHVCFDDMQIKNIRIL